MIEILERVGGWMKVKDADWTIEHREYERCPAGSIGEFVWDYLKCGRECWPSVLKDLEAFYESGENEFCLDEAIGAGKSYTASLIIAYEVHKLLCLKDPQAYLGFARGSKLAVMNMSVNATQAYKVVFGEVRARIENSLWFRDGMMPNPDKKSELEWERKQVYVLSGNSRETYPMGYNLVCAVLDEAAWFVETERKNTAEEIYFALKRRLQSRFGKRYRWLLGIISSPRYVDDFVEKRMAEEEGFRLRRTLWDARPEMFEGWPDSFSVWEGVRIPKQLLKDAEGNPERFKRDFMAIPSFTLEPYLKERGAIWDCAKEALANGISDGAIRMGLTGDPKYVYYAHVDLGLSRDACGLAVGHAEGNMVVIDSVWRWNPERGSEVNFAQIRDVILRLRELGFRFGKVSYDGWQSVDSIQSLRAKGIEAETLSVDRDLEAYDTLKGLLYERRVAFPRYEPLLEELERLELKKGVKVDHPPQGSKDVADAVAGVCFWAIQDTKQPPAGILIDNRSYKKEIGKYEKSMF